MEEPIQYRKQKFVYVVSSETHASMFGFGNLKDVWRWFAFSTMFLPYHDLDYDRMVQKVRRNGWYGVSHMGTDWKISAVKMWGKTVRSAKRSREMRP